ncbi:Hypothetical predicted protein [Octopus vulgaris]|uniref:Uncharacterized protein n=1 Tax=Octopus vulgaris TaxID=6645 RepID=A0AA36F3Q2_OCTVU|nr:Hypothetical predicted protein [Octopus vulgaris]
MRRIHSGVFPQTVSLARRVFTVHCGRGKSSDSETSRAILVNTKNFQVPTLSMWVDDSILAAAQVMAVEPLEDMSTSEDCHLDDNGDKVNEIHNLVYEHQRQRKRRFYDEVEENEGTFDTRIMLSVVRVYYNCRT